MFCYCTLAEQDINLVDFIKEHDSYLNLPEIDKDENPLNLETIKES